jgi:DNA-binding transcriptional MerR regulator
MVVYSIKDLENLTGVKAHTLRIWEQRYGIIEPKRTETNIRYYLEEDLKYILKVALLNKNGVKISKIACLSKEEIIRKTAEIADFSPLMGDTLDGLTMSILNLDEFKLNHILEAHINQIGFEAAFERVIFPLLDKISYMWMMGSMTKVHETFLTNMIIRKTVAQIDKCPLINECKNPLIILFLLEGENQDLIIHFMNYLLRRMGFRVMNLGKNVTIDQVKEACELTNADYVFTIFNELFSEGKLQEQINLMSTNLCKCKFLISGYQTLNQQIIAPENCQVLPGLKEIKSYFVSAKETQLVK